MKKTTTLLLTAALSLSTLAHATTPFVPPVPDIAGKAYFVTDFYSGQVVAARDPDTRIEPASLTKLMTAYLTFKALKEKRLTLDQMLTVSQVGWKQEGSRMFLDPKVPVSVDNLIKGMIVQSGNDACVTLAEAIAGSEEVFAQMMTTEAKRLGMSASNFKNSTGLPHPEHYTTTRDLATLSTAIIHDFPEFYPIYSMKSFSYNNITQPNRNLLLYRDPNVDGMKTGHTASEEARAVESSKLLNYALQFFETPKLYEARKPVSEVAVYKGASNKLPVGFASDVYITVPKGQSSQLKADLTTTQPMIAPVAAGQTVGKLTVSLAGKVVLERPVVALQAVEEGGFFSRLWDSIKLWLGW